jgi:hypothetical protein
MALSIGLFMTACSMHSEVSFDKSISATKQLGDNTPAKVETNTTPTPDANPTPSIPAPATPAPSDGAKTCNKPEDCNKIDELCLTGICQSVSHIKQTFGFTDDSSFDPCPARPCPNCTAGAQKRTGMSYGNGTVDISAMVCVDCQFNDACNTGFRCMHEQCVDAATHTYCDFDNQCLDGYTCTNSQCVKQ